MEGVLPVMMRPMTINYLLPFPLTIHASKNIMKLLYPKLLQGLLENLLSIEDSILLLHLLEEVRSMEPKNLLWILGCILLLRNSGLPAVWLAEILHPHLT
jgi:hypothetical protein